MNRHQMIHRFFDNFEHIRHDETRLIDFYNRHLKPIQDDDIPLEYTTDDEEKESIDFRILLFNTLLKYTPKEIKTIEHNYYEHRLEPKKELTLKLF